MSWLVVFIGGGLGSISRYGIGKGLAQYGSDLPVGTLLANISACLVLGIVIGAFGKGDSNSLLKLGLTTGFCGGFSTFSTYSLEGLELIQNSKPLLGGAYIIGSILISFVLLLFGLWLGRSLAS